MPGGDKTGPEGKGPMTGGKRGFCTGNDTAGSNNSNGMGRRNFGSRGRGQGGRGGGQRGFRNMFFKTGKTFWERFNDSKNDDDSNGDKGK